MKWCRVCSGELPCQYGHSQIDPTRVKMPEVEMIKERSERITPLPFNDWPDRDNFIRVYHAFRVGADIKTLENYIANA